MKRAAVAAGLLAAAVGVSACGSDESREDANDVVNGNVEKSAPHTTAFNNHYSNVQSKCLRDGAHGPGTGLRVVVTTDKRFVVIPDPHCPGYMPEQAATVASGGNQP